jgi:beta-barrel assembly-enhancing protease
MRRLFSRSLHSELAGLTLGCLLCAMSAPAFAENQKKDPDAIGDRKVTCKMNWYSIEKEIALGKQLAQQVERQSRIISDPVVSEYVNRIGQNLVRNSDAKVPFTIKVIDGEEVNAFALPGGFFFVYSGLITKADTESELAGVMAHEIAHVAARHGTCQATKGELAQISMIPLIMMTGGMAGYAIYEGASILVPMTFLKFSRNMEAEADYLGLQYMYKTGYDPESFVDFFEKIETLEKRKPGTMAKVFSTHPPTGDRIVAAQNEIAKILKEKPEYVVTTSEFNDVKARLAMLENRRKLTDATSNDPNKPTLRKNPNSTGPIDDDSGSSTKSKGDDEDRPQLKRRPSDSSDDSSGSGGSSGPGGSTTGTPPPNN